MTKKEFTVEDLLKMCKDVDPHSPIKVFQSENISMLDSERITDYEIEDVYKGASGSLVIQVSEGSTAYID